MIRNMYEGIDADKLYTSSLPNSPRAGLRGISGGADAGIAQANSQDAARAEHGEMGDRVDGYED